MAVALVDDQRILWQGTYGFTTLKKDKPVTPRTLFSLQSMSKSFTALGVLMAVQDGLLDLDRPVSEYLPDFSVHSRFEEHPERVMTLRHLLAHRAGFTHEAPLGGNYDSRPQTFAEHILSISDTWLRYPVGARTSYSNLGIDLAGWILEKKSGRPFVDYIREKVLAPLGMNDSTLDIAAILKAEDRAVGNRRSRVEVPGGIPVEVPPLAAGGVYTNILDMARYLMFHLNAGRSGGTQLLKRDLLEEMVAVQFPEKGERFGYGLGIRSTQVGPEIAYGHAGGGYGFNSVMSIYPGLKLGIVALSNIEGNPVLGSISSLVPRIVGVRSPGPGPESEYPEIGTRNPVAASDARLKGFAGEFTGRVSVGTGKDGAFGITIANQFHPLAFAVDPDGGLVGLFDKDAELRMKPPQVPGEPGTLVILKRLAGTCQYYDFVKPEAAMDRPGPDRPEWKSYLGVYRTLLWGRVPDSTVNIGIAEGYLTKDGVRCREYLPGLFFTPDGEALDFRGTVATFANILLIRTMR